MFKFIGKTVHELNSIALKTQKPFTKAYEEYFTVNFSINRCGFAPKRALFNAKYGNQESFTVDYLIKTCGFAPKGVLFAANYANLAVENGEVVSKKANQGSFTVNYLVNRCGVAPERALSAAKYLNFDKPDKPDAVMSFLQKQGFTETQVFKIVRKFPPLVLCDPRKTLLPKIEFFQSQGFSKSDLDVVFAVLPAVFKTSLERKIAPSFNFYKNLLGSVKDTILAVKQNPEMLLKLQSHAAPNIEVLRKAGVTDGRIAYMLKFNSRVLMRSPHRFKEWVDEVEKMGFDPRMSTFVVAIIVIGSVPRSKWQNKIEVCKRWGFSEDDVLATFKHDPWFMGISEDKIERTMEFLVNKMGCESSILMKSSHLFSYSLNKRIIPRCSVYEVLRSKGLVKRSCGLYNIVSISERMFLKRFIKCYEKEAPELLKIYQEKLEHSD